jgi:MoxR-like ATPase
LFAEVVLADEINRATPRTQSALLEAMSERQVSVDGETHPLGPPFLVLATQNPYEFEGTYVLPEGQLDRFLLRIRIGYPDRAVEKQILMGHRGGEPVEHLEPVMSKAVIVRLQEQVRQVRVDDSLNDYLLDVVDETRRHPDLYLGASPRAALGLYRAAQALALIRGRDFVVPDDIKQLAGPVRGHRLLSRSFRQGEPSEAALTLVNEILARVRVPV